MHKKSDYFGKINKEQVIINTSINGDILMSLFVYLLVGAVVAVAAIWFFNRKNSEKEQVSEVTPPIEPAPVVTEAPIVVEAVEVLVPVEPKKTAKPKVTKGAAKPKPKASKKPSMKVAE